ncbi:MAG: TolC family protein [Thermodesulfobacteriota bacterium]
MIKILLLIGTLLLPSLSGGKELFRLEDCIKIALQNRVELNIADLDILHAENMIKEAKSYYYPKTNLMAGYTHFRKPSTFDADVDITAIKKPIQPLLSQYGIEIPSVIPQEVEVGKKDWFSVGIDLNQPIYTFGRLKEGVKQAEIAHSISLVNKEKTKKDIIFEVKRSFYSLQYLRKLHQLLKEMEARSGVVEKMVEIAYTTETLEKDSKPVTKLDYLKAKNFRSEIKARLVEVEKNLKLSFSSLRLAMGINGERPFDIVELPLEKVPQREIVLRSEEIKKKALERNPDLKASRLQVNLFESKKKASKLEYLPVVALQGQYIGPEDRYGVSHFWYLGIALKVPIFDGFLTRAKIGQAESQFLKARTQKGLYERALPIKLEHLLISLEEMRKEAEILKDAIKDSEERTELSADGFSIGSVEYDDLLLSQRTELELRSAYLKSLYDYHKTQAEIEYLSGED